VKHQEIILGLAPQTLIYDVPEGRPAADPVPTAQVFDAGMDDDGEAESATSGAVSIDSVNTTIASSAASAGDSAITVESAAGITRRRRYLLTDTDGDCEWVEVISISGTTVGLRRPLLNSYEIGSTFAGTRISVTVEPAWSADDSNLSDAPSCLGAAAAGYRVRWTYTVGGAPTIGVSYADLVRYPTKNLVTPPMVDDRFPGWIDKLPIDHRRDQGAQFIAEAFDAVKADALGDAQVLRRIRDTEVLSELVKYRANVIAIENNVLNGSQTLAELQTAERLYDTRYGQLVRFPKVPVDQTGEGGASSATRLPLTVR
jgi:hypothetical protein